MSLSISFILTLIPVVLSLLAVYLIYKIYAFNRLNKAWLLLAVGFILIVVLRFLIFLKGEGVFPSFFSMWGIYEPIIRILISLFQLLGFWAMLKNFENFEVVEKKVKKLVRRK